MVSKRNIRITSVTLLILMLFGLILTITHISAADTQGMSFSSGYDSMYYTDKSFSVIPKTFEARIGVPSSYGDQYWGDIFAWYSAKSSEHYLFWDIHAPSSTDIRLLCGIRDENGKITEEIIVKFVGALNEYRGKDVDLALTFDTENKDVRLYIDGNEWNGTPTYTSSGNATASESGLFDLYAKLDPAKFADFAIGGDFRPKDLNSQWKVHHVDNWRYFRGTIHTVSAFKDVRSPDEIKGDTSALPKDDADLIMSFYPARAIGSSIITDESGNGYDLRGTPEWANSKSPVTDYAYSFAVVGDTQVITRDEAVTSSETYDPAFEGNLDKIYDWIVANKTDKNILFSFHMGDVTDWNNAAEWDLAMSNISKMDGIIPYNIVRGNHDAAQTFIERYTMSSFESNVSDGEEYGTFDQNTLNTFQTITVGNIKYLMLALDLGPCRAVIDWANEVIASHPFHNVIISTHSYLHRSGAYMDDPLDCSATQYNPGGKYNGGTGNGTPVYWDFRLDKYKSAGIDYLYQDASYMWNNLVRKHKNICMVLCGHEISDQILNVETVGDHGNKIAQILIDPQGVDRRLQSSGQGHAGLVAMLYFSEDGKTVTTEYYSTIRDQYYKETLNNQIFELDVITVPENFNALHVEVAKAEALVENDYSVEDWEDISTAIEEAKTKLDSTDDTVISEAVTKLRSLIEEKVKLDREALEAAIAKANSYKRKQSQYTKESWSELEAALAEATATLEGSRVQADINSSAEKLSTAVKSLVKIEKESAPTQTEPAESKTEAPAQRSGGCSSSLTQSTTVVILITLLSLYPIQKKKK